MKLSIGRYATECGVSRNAIYMRLKTGAVKSENFDLPDGRTMKTIDTDKFPPQKWELGRPNRKQRNDR